MSLKDPIASINIIIILILLLLLFVAIAIIASIIICYYNYSIIANIIIILMGLKKTYTSYITILKNHLNSLLQPPQSWLHLCHFA